MTTYLTPITGFTRSGDLSQLREAISLGNVILRPITEEELRQHLHVSNRVLDDQGNLVSCTTHVDMTSGPRMLGDLQKIKISACTHVLVSELPVEEHTSVINDILHCWRLLRMSRVACPITYNTTSPSWHFMYPIEGSLGDRLRFDSTLLDETLRLYADIRKVPREDLDLIDLANKTGANTLTVFVLVVIAERSLMQGDDKEISFKVSVYGSLLLKNLGIVDAESAFLLLRKAYTMRSAFAHGGKMSHSDINEFLPSLYEYVCMIRRYTALHPDLLTQEWKRSLLFGKTNQSG